MSTPVRTADGSMAVREASRILWRESIGSLVVGEKPIRGIVTASDVVRGVGAGHDPEHLSLEELMSTDVVTVDTMATVREVAKTMATEEVKHLPVVEHTDGRDRLVGMVTSTDLAHSLAPTFDDVLDAFS